MSGYEESFLSHLSRLRESDTAAMAELRRSLSFTPGAYPPVYPYVERFVPKDSHALSSRRLALYLVAGLFAQHPQTASSSLAASFGRLMRKRDDNPSIEKRFIALLGADAENLSYYLRQVVSLLAAEEIGLDYTALLKDLSFWLNPRIDPDRRDRIRQQWARDFYRALAQESEPETATEHR